MVTQGSTADILQRVLATRSDVLRHLTDAHEAAYRAVDPRLLDLCRLRVAQLLGCPEQRGSVVDEATLEALPQWPTHHGFDSTERACLAFAEQFVIDVASMPDDMALAVVDALGAEGCADFVNALLVVEQRQRLRLAWERLLPSLAEPEAIP